MEANLSQLCHFIVNGLYGQILAIYGAHESDGALNQRLLVFLTIPRQTLLEGKNNATRGSKEVRNPVIRGIFAGERPGVVLFLALAVARIRDTSSRQPKRKRIGVYPPSNLRTDRATLIGRSRPSFLERCYPASVWDKSRCKRAKRSRLSKSKKRIGSIGEELHKRNRKVGTRTLDGTISFREMLNALF